jgi:hypothetical protein
VRKLLHRGWAQFELTRWPEGSAFRDVADALRWLSRLDRDDANARVLSELHGELGAGDWLKLSHDERLRLLAYRLVRLRWGLRQAGLSLQPAATAQLAAGATAAEDRVGDRPHEEEDIIGYLLEDEDESGIEAGIEAEGEEGQLEADLVAEAEADEIEALMLSSGPAPPTERPASSPSPSIG